MTHRFDMKLPPPVVTLAIALLMWGLAHLFPVLNFDFAFRLTVAILFMVTGVVTGAAAVVAMLRARTTLDSRQPYTSSVLVTSGVYRVTRNPMYLGLLFVLFGWGIYLGNPASMLVAFILVFWLGRFQIEPEEQALADRFGAHFEDYRATVRRWL